MSSPGGLAVLLPTNERKAPSQPTALSSLVTPHKGGSLQDPPAQAPAGGFSRPAGRLVALETLWPFTVLVDPVPLSACVSAGLASCTSRCCTYAVHMRAGTSRWSSRACPSRRLNLPPPPDVQAQLYFPPLSDGCPTRSATSAAARAPVQLPYASVLLARLRLTQLYVRWIYVSRHIMHLHLSLRLCLLRVHGCTSHGLFSPRLARLYFAHYISRF
ncbi:hypothetical protein FB451DRAFT_1565865 [Mycena latifolia]|nr:hypothetical protein FB451DRAFT_1565865 [Mycena latifolia]